MPIFFSDGPPEVRPYKGGVLVTYQSGGETLQVWLSVHDYLHARRKGRNVARKILRSAPTPIKGKGGH